MIGVSGGRVPLLFGPQSILCLKFGRNDQGLQFTKNMIRVGFEPTPFRTSALSWRLRPLGHLTFVTVPGGPSALIHRGRLPPRFGIECTCLAELKGWRIRAIQSNLTLSNYLITRTNSINFRRAISIDEAAKID